MPQFLISSSSISENEIVINEVELFRHIAFALRSRLGSGLRLIDENEIVYETLITRITTSKIVTKIISQYKSARKLEYDISIAQCVLKNDAQGFVIQKATELGISKIYPLISDNVSVKHDWAFSRTPKWQKIVAEAVKQCERANVPSVEPTSHLLGIIQSKDFDKILIFVEAQAKSTLKEYLAENEFSKEEKILLVIGPEGGFSTREFEIFQKSKLPMLSISKLILKAETAAVCAISNFIFGVSDE